MKRHIAAVAGCALVLAACQAEQGPTDVGVPEAMGPALDWSDGASGDPDANEHFFFLPPLVDQPSFDGELNPDLVPQVRICPTPADCTSEQAVLERAADLRGDHYQFDWRTSRNDDGETFRILVVIGETVLGFLDVELLNRVRGNGRPSGPNDNAQVRAGRTVPVKFRIEEGALCSDAAISCGEEFIEAEEGGTVNADEGLGFQVEGDVLSNDATVIIERVECPTDDEGRVNFFPFLDLPQFGGCFQLRAEPPTTDIDDEIGALVGSCLEQPTGLSAAQEDRLLIHRTLDRNDQNEVIQALPNEDAPFVNCDDFADAQLNPVLRWAARGWRAVNPLVARPAYATHVGFGGRTVDFSDYVWALPAQMEALPGTQDQTAAPNTAVENPPGVRVTDVGGDPVEGARVTFDIVLGDGTLDPASPATIVTGSDGIAETNSWTLGEDLNHTVEATGRGIGEADDGGPFTTDDLPPAEVGTGVVMFDATTIQGEELPIEYNSEDWKALQTGSDDDFPTDEQERSFEDPDFDDSDWGSAQAPFWDNPGDAGCSVFGNLIQSTNSTKWQGVNPSATTDPNEFSHIFLRKRFFLASAEEVTLRVGIAIDNDFRAFVNGEEITANITSDGNHKSNDDSGGHRADGTDEDGTQRHEGCAQLDDFVLSVPSEFLLEGVNVVAVFARDRGVAGYVDVKVTESE